MARRRPHYRKNPSSKEWVGIAVAGAAVVGLVVYFATRSKSAPEAVVTPDVPAPLPKPVPYADIIDVPPGSSMTVAVGQRLALGVNRSLLVSQSSSDQTVLPQIATQGGYEYLAIAPGQSTITSVMSQPIANGFVSKTDVTFINVKG